MSEEQPIISGDQNMEDAAPVVDDSADTQPEQPQTVPLAALQSERSQRQQLQDELKMIKDHVALLQITQQQAIQQNNQKDDLDNLEDGDVLTVGEAKKYLSRMSRKHQMSIEELKIMQKHTDYQEIITKYLPEVLKTNPGLKRSLEQTQDYELAYHLAKNSDTYREDNKRSKKSIEAQRIVENSQKAGNLSSMGATTPISQAKRYKDMSTDDFRALTNKNLGII